MRIQGKQIVNYYGLAIPDKNLTPNTCSTDGADTGITISRQPLSDITVAINGVQKVLGDGVATKDCYFGNAAFGRFSFSTINATSHCVTLHSGAAWGWGLGTSGQLGQGTSIVSRSSPVSVVGGHSFTQINCGDDQGTPITSGLKSDGTVWVWGGNSFGQNGDNTTIARSSPVSVVGAHSFIQVSAGLNTVIALKSVGTAWCWGRGNNGQLGDNTTVVNGRSSPISVVGAHSFISVSGGGMNNNGALKADGSVWTWGSNSNGQLGDGTNTTKSSPTSVVGAHSFIIFNYASCDGTLGAAIALKADGSAWNWGSNTSGALGDGTTVSKSSPTSVIGGHSFIDVAGGARSHALGLKADGSVWVWGLNSSGQLGDNTTVNKSSPVSVVGGHSFIHIDGGVNICVALKSDGSVWAWGSNAQGRLGDGTTVSKSSPISVTNTGGFDASATVRNILDVVLGDRLFWNATIATQNLTSADRVDLNYMAFPFI